MQKGSAQLLRSCLVVAKGFHDSLRTFLSRADAAPRPLISVFENHGVYISRLSHTNSRDFWFTVEAKFFFKKLEHGWLFCLKCHGHPAIVQKQVFSTNKRGHVTRCEHLGITCFRYSKKGLYSNHWRNNLCDISFRRGFIKTVYIDTSSSAKRNVIFKLGFDFWHIKLCVVIIVMLATWLALLQLFFGFYWR